MSVDIKALMANYSIDLDKLGLDADFGTLDEFIKNSLDEEDKRRKAWDTSTAAKFVQDEIVKEIRDEKRRVAAERAKKVDDEIESIKKKLAEMAAAATDNLAENGELTKFPVEEAHPILERIAGDEALCKEFNESLLRTTPSNGRGVSHALRVPATLTVWNEVTQSFKAKAHIGGETFWCSGIYLGKKKGVIVRMKPIELTAYAWAEIPLEQVTAAFGDGVEKRLLLVAKDMKLEDVMNKESAKHYDDFGSW